MSLIKEFSIHKNGLNPSPAIASGEIMITGHRAILIAFLPYDVFYDFLLKHRGELTDIDRKLRENKQ